MKNKYFLSFIFFINFFIFSFNLKATPDSFADLVEELLPAVVSIASTTIVENKNNQPIPRFPEGSPFDEFFKEYFDNERPSSPKKIVLLSIGLLEKLEMRAAATARSAPVSSTRRPPAPFTKTSWSKRFIPACR